VGQTIKPSYYRPPPVSKSTDHAQCNEGKTTEQPLPRKFAEEEWVLVDSTPASCVQIGLHHYFKDRGPIDLVVSGPNYGRNTTAVFALSSGTLGGALEGAVCGARSIALSYAFFKREHETDIISAASRTAVRIVEGLAKNWDPSVQLYSVNIPLNSNVETTKVLWTHMLQNQWSSGSCFTEIEVPQEEDTGAEDDEAKIRAKEGREETKGKHSVNGDSTANGFDANGHASNGDTNEPNDRLSDTKSSRYTHKHFKWSPRFTDVSRSVDEAAAGNDGWAIKEGFIRFVLRLIAIVDTDLGVV
jgi:tubulin--tyrosine ligase